MHKKFDDSIRYIVYGSLTCDVGNKKSQSNLGRVASPTLTAENTPRSPHQLHCLRVSHSLQMG